jgi:V8-like Glu-specific endopeptidase
MSLINDELGKDYAHSVAMFATVRILTTSPDFNDGGQGTGFLILIEKPDRNKLLLISNKHVLGNPKWYLNINFVARSLHIDEPVLGEIAKLEINDFSSNYYRHPDETVDLACLDISNYRYSRYLPYLRYIGRDDIEDYDLIDLYPGAGIWFIGFPDGRFDTANNLPIMRRGYAASFPGVNFEGKEEFLIDGFVVPGSSGSPVFAEINRKFCLIGVLTEAFNYKVNNVERHLNLGKVIKVSRVRELINFCLEMSFRND